MSRFACLLAALLFIAGCDPTLSQKKKPGSAAADAGSGEHVGQPLTAPTRTETIEGILKRLQEGYVFPDVAQRMQEVIHERARKGEYDGITWGEDLARILTAHLREVGHDPHIVVNYSPKRRPKGPPSEPNTDEQANRKKEATAVNFGRRPGCR